MYLIQLKDMAERLPQGAYEADPTKLRSLPNGIDSHISHHIDSIGLQNANNRDDGLQQHDSDAQIHPAVTNGISEPNHAPRDGIEANGIKSNIQDHEFSNPIGMGKNMNTKHESDAEADPHISSSRYAHPNSNGSKYVQTTENGAKLRSPTATVSQVEAEWIEQYEPGVYITLTALRDGTRDLKRVRFRYLRQSLVTLFCAHVFHHFLIINKFSIMSYFRIPWQSKKIRRAASRSMVVGESRKGV